MMNNKPNKLKLFEINKIRTFISALFKAAGVNSRDSSHIMSSLLYAEQRGIFSHGLIRIPYYIQRIEKGGINANPRIQTFMEKKACAIINGDNAMGQVSGTSGMRKAVSLACKYNVGVVSVQRGSHFGAASYFSSMALKRNYIGVAVSNASAVMAPTGGKKALIGNNPISVAVPSSSQFPIILDMALSSAALGKFLVARQQKKSIPPGLAIDCHGKPTTDPDEALSGTVLPMGGYKGYGLALIADIFCGVLAGTSFGPQVGSLLKGDGSRPTDNSFFFLALNIGAFIPVRRFKERIAQYVQLIKTSPPAYDSEGVFLPGEKEWQYYIKNKNRAIAVDKKLYKDLNILAKRFKIKPL